jgi:hypothetical protein
MLSFRLVRLVRYRNVASQDSVSEPSKLATELLKVERRLIVTATRMGGL